MTNSSKWNRVSALECSSGKNRIKRPRPSANSFKNSPHLPLALAMNTAALRHISARAVLNNPLCPDRTASEQ